MELETTNLGWVIVHKDGIVHDFTFKSTRSECIKEWSSIWSAPDWRADKREGYKCVRAKQTVRTY